MALSAPELANIAASALEEYIDKGKLWVQNVANKPMLKAFNAGAGKFSGGNAYVNIGVKSGQGGGSLAGYTHTDTVTYYNPVGAMRAKWAWKEHHIGTVFSHTEAKIDGIDIVEDDASQTKRPMEGREEHVLANLIDEKNEDLGEDFAYSLDQLVHGDGVAAPLALAGIQSLILANPILAGNTGGIDRVANTWWRNRAATAVYGTAGGQGAITSATTAGGALIEFMEKEWLQLSKYRKGSTKYRIFAGSDWIAAYRKEMRANGYYTNTGFTNSVVDGSQGAVEWHGVPIEWDPTLDGLTFGAAAGAKRCYVLDMSKSGLRLLYMDGQRMKRHNPARPYDKYVMYQGITTTCVMIAKQLNTSGVYDIA